MRSDQASMLWIVLRTLKLSIFVAGLSIIAGILIGFVTGRFILGATFVTLCFFCGLVGFLPFRQNYFSISGKFSQGRLLGTIILEVSFLVAVAYAIVIGVMRTLGVTELAWLSNAKSPYIIAPACFYIVVVTIMTVALILSQRAPRRS